MAKKANKKKEKMLKILGKRMEQSNAALSNVKEGVKATPQLEEIRKSADLQIKAIQNITDEFEIPKEMIEITEYENQLFEEKYGPLFSKEIEIDTEYSPIVSGSSCAMAFYHQVSQEDNYKKAKMEWAEENIGEFIKLNDELKRKQVTGDLIKKINPAIADEFYSAIEDFSRLKYDIIKIPDLALRFRTIMEKVKGDLNVKLLLPMIKVKSGKILEELANRFTGGVGSPDYNLLCTENKNYRDIHSELTDVGKLNKRYSTSDFEVLTTRYADNLYGILSILAGYKPNIFK